MSAATGIYTPGSIWAKAIEQSKSQKKSEAKDDAYAYFVGSKGSGKSTLLNRFLYPSKLELPKPSQGLEYTFARKASNYGHERKDLAHIWEVAGSDAFAQQLALQGSQIFLSYRQVTTAVVVIVLDLSDPGSVIPTALQWLELVKRKLASTYSLFERKGLQLPEQLRARQRAKLLSQHDDKELVNCTGISLVFAATKWDVFRDKVEPEGQKVMARCLRWLAHSHAAHLLYLGGLQPGRTAAAAASGSDGSSSSASASSAGPGQQVQSLQLLDNFSRLLNHLLFVGMDRKMPLKLPPQFDHLQPLMIPAGSDRFRDIGRPHAPLQTGSSSSSSSSLGPADVTAAQQEWVALTVEMFSSSKLQEQRDRFELDARYKEEDVDNARARREAALEVYRREVEAIKREEAAARKHKAAAAAAAAAGGVPAGTSSAGQQQLKQQQLQRQQQAGLIAAGRHGK